MRTLLITLLALPLAAQAPAARPKILGMANMALYVSDLEKARDFYEGMLGFEEPFTLPKPDGSVQMVFVKINDHQYLELFNEPNKGEGQLNHIAAYTDNADRMRDPAPAASRPGNGRKGAYRKREFHRHRSGRPRCGDCRIHGRWLERQRQRQAHARGPDFHPHVAPGSARRGPR